MNRRILLVAVCICLLCMAEMSAVSPVQARESYQHYGYREIQETSDNTWLDVDIINHHDTHGVLIMEAKVRCNYTGLSKAGISGLNNVVFRTQHGVARLKSMCTCVADSEATISFNRPYGVPGASMPTDRELDLMNTLILEKVTAQDSKTGRPLELTRHIGLDTRKPPVLIAR